MGASIPRDLTKLEQQRLCRWPCDGKVRFQIKESNRKVPYGEAYDAICKVTGSVLNADKALVFTVAGRRRITALNKLYYPLAKNFIGFHLYRMEQEKKRQEEEKAKFQVGRVEPVHTNP